MLKAKRLATDSSAGTKTHRHPFWKTASTPVAPPQVSEAETIKTKAASKPSVVGIVRAHQSQAQPVTQSTSASNTTYSRQNPASSSFHVVRANQQAATTSTPVAAATAPAPSRVQAPIAVPQQHQQQALANKNFNKSNPPIPKPGSSAVHRVSIQSLNSANTASTSRSSFEHISAENLEHSWGSGATFSTAPSSTFPTKSTDSLVRIPASSSSELRDQQNNREAAAASRRFPLVESDSQRKPVEPSSKTHGDTQGEQASNALPLPNSEYESPARVRSLRRSKPNINLSSSTSSIRDATSTTGRQSPAPGPSSIIPPSSSAAAAASAAKSPEPQEHHHQRSKSDMLAITEFAYVRPSHRMEEHVRGGSGDHGRATLLARVMATSSTKHTQSPSTASARTMPATTTHAPRVSSHSQQANPNMTKLKQTSIPRISTSGIATASPMIEQTRHLDSLQSPLKASAEQSLSAWTSVKSPIMTSSSSTNPAAAAAAYSTLTSASVMSPNLSSVTSPRTLVSGSHHHSDIAAITPAQQHYSLSSSVSSASSAVSSSTITTRTPYVEADYDSPSSTATPGTPASNTVRALFSSFTSRSHRNSTPHPPIRGSSLSNPPITAQEVDSPRIGHPGHILSPPPLPPQSTRPDAPQQSFTALHHAQIQAQQEQLLHQQLFNSISSPRHGTPDLRTSVHSSRPSADTRREMGGLRSPSPNSILRSYGLAADSTGNNNAVQSPSVNAQKGLMGTPLFHSPRTLMSDAEVTTVTHVSITRSTVVMPADQAVAYGHSIERRNSSSSSRNSPVVSTNSRGGNGSQQQLANSISQIPQSPLSQSQPVNGGFFGIFRPKSPRHPFPRAESPAPAPPVPSKTPPPRTATASPSGRRFAFSLPINLRHKPKKSISGASVEARVGTPGGDGPMSSQGSLLQARTSEVHFSELPAGHGDQQENGRRRTSTSVVGGGRRSGDAMETDTEFEDGGEDDDQPIEMKMREVQQWSQTIEANWATSGKRRSRPGVSFDVPASESERDDTGMTAVSVAPGGGRMLRYARAHARQHQQFSQQFSDNESLAVF